ncbi:Cyclin-L2 [Rhodotorula toruloides]|nr:Cyclin-L2 [Rhodotorula toruloides]
MEPQVVMATAQVLFQRFWFVTSLKHFGIRDVAMGALFLSSKLEESPLRIRDIINCFSYLESLIAYSSTPPYPPPSSFDSYAPMDYFATEFYDMKDALVIAEMQILKRLGFQTQCGLPYGHLVNYLQVLELTSEKELVRRCWGYCNDMLQTPAPALYPQGTLALASIYLSARLSFPPIALPLEPVPWWTHFDTIEDELVHVSTMLLRLYKDWGNDSLGPGKADGERNGHGGFGVVGRENVWRRAKRIPVTKSGLSPSSSAVGMTRNRFIIGGPAPWPAFTAVNDSIRGGSSTSSFAVNHETNVATFAGHLDYTTLGGAGFASQSTTFEPSRLSLPRSTTSGLFLTFLPPLSPPSHKTPTKFTLNIKDSKPERRPDGRRESVTVYEFEVDVEEYRDDGLFDEKVDADVEKGEGKARRSVTVLAKWDDFKPFYRGKPKEDAAPLDPSAIYE